MKERILRLCKRLDKFSFEDISTIADDVNESTLELLLLTLVDEKRLTVRNNIYFYNKNGFNNQNISYNQIRKLPRFFQYHTKEEITLIMKCFCAEIPAQKVCKICSVGQNAVFNLYNFIREHIFKTQFKQLNKLYNQKPKQVRYRKLFDKCIYMYVYGNEVFVTDKVLNHRKEERAATKAEVKEFKKICCYLSRIECHNKNEINLHFKIAEALWRRNKNFEELFNNLNSNLLNLS